METSEATFRWTKLLRDHRSPALGRTKRCDSGRRQHDSLIYDVISPFILTDMNLGNKITEELLKGRYPNQSLETISELPKVGLYTRFKFNGDVYEQIKRTLMDSHRDIPLKR